MKNILFECYCNVGYKHNDINYNDGDVIDNWWNTNKLSDDNEDANIEDGHSNNKDDPDINSNNINVNSGQ